ncbi:origin recognition complex subunit 1 [Megalops cyprinoides]|uniref:origin recognition complex subunit 1 n=1 Tax=Megalops cyprinoides TaxID=118141 RepID=UPI00186490AC|nr:origin recognition complex subunit 1 [Megalops cyprinoides]
MSRYFTRLKMRRVYRWAARPYAVDRKLKTCYYDALYLNMDGKPEDLLIKTGQYILIEGEDDDNPYVAKVLKFFDDETGKNKRATVQWFVRCCEVPHNKRKLLGRKPHPQEIFLYQDRSCDTEISAETIINTVQVKHLPMDAAFPETENGDTLYVKLSWDRKAFKVWNGELLLQDGVVSQVPAAAAPAPRALPTPDLAVMKRAMCGTSVSRVSMSTGKLGASEAESGHSASKLSASKDLSKRRQHSSSTPGVRKKLELGSPGKKLTREDILGELLDDEVKTQNELTSKMPSTPPRILNFSISLSPLKCTSELPNGVRIAPLKTGQGSTSHSAPPLQDQDSTSVRQVLESGPPKAPRRKRPPPGRAVQGGRSEARTPSNRKDSSSSIREPALAALPEEHAEETAVTPRSKRKSAQLVSARIRKQLKLINTGQGPSLDGEDDSDEDDQFVPSKKDLQSSSEGEEEEESEDESIVVKRRRSTAGSRTPRSTQKSRTPARTPSKTPRKTPSKKAAPGTPRTPRTPRHATPSIPCRSLPARKPGNVLEEARARLHVSAVPESLPCREQEFQDIYSFVESKVIDGTGGCMYISGVPGTGKTATVHEVIRCLQHAADQDEIPSFRFIEINGMKMTDPHQAYVQILQKLTDQKATADHAAALLEKRFSNPAPKKETTVLLVDELDLLWTRKQNVMYNLFDWPTRRHARLAVLAIANTMDLPERIMINRVASRLGLTRMSFQPYSFKQLQQIITSRLNRVKAFEEDALQLVSRKVAALSGDARRCLDICRRATEICELSSGQQSGAGLVGMSHVMEALDEMFSSSYVTAIRCASLQEQLFLRAVIAEFRRLGLEEATFQQVFVQHQALCRVEGLQPISVSEGLAVCQRLGACRLLLLEPSRLDLLLRVRLNVSQDDVLYALKED